MRFWYVDNGVEPVANPRVEDGLDLIYSANISATTLSGSLQRITLMLLITLVSIRNRTKRLNW